MDAAVLNQVFAGAVMLLAEGQGWREVRAWAAEQAASAGLAVNDDYVP